MHMKLYQLTEAKYYRDNVTVDQVANMYYDAYEDLDTPGLDLDKPRVMGPADRTILVTMLALVHTSDEQKAIGFVQRFLKNNNLPYTDVKADDGTSHIPNSWDRIILGSGETNPWTVVMIEYDEDNT